VWIKSRTRSIRRGSRGKSEPTSVQDSEKRCGGGIGSNKAKKKSTPSGIAGRGELPPTSFSKFYGDGNCRTYSSA
jgi:hypothetical protein